MKDFLTAIQERRSDYGISNAEVVPYEKLKEILDFSVKHTPTAFNAQMGKVALLLGEHHANLWDSIHSALEKIVPPENFAATAEKLAGFKNGHGTILYFVDDEIVESLQNRFPVFKDNFPKWGEQANGMLQLVVWTALKQVGYGASLQHYNEVIESSIKEQLKIPTKWRLVAQMPFGKAGNSFSEKEFLPIDGRVLVYK
ncbi:MAG: nitroreductase family protein [Firmicutes bacterium]|nr:nitroreductase family protein [Bacillota bacterium]